MLRLSVWRKAGQAGSLFLSRETVFYERNRLKEKSPAGMRARAKNLLGKGRKKWKKGENMDIRAKIEEANQRVTEIFMKARPVWTKIAPAIDVIPGMEKNKILVAGPPIAVEDITIPVRTAVCGAAVHDGLAKTPREAWEKVEAGEIIIDSAQNHDCGCSAAMATSASMPVIVCEDPVYGGVGYAPIHPGNSPKVLRWGFYDEEIEAHLRWFRDYYSVALDEAVRNAGGIDIVQILAKTAGMGDENHNRLFASSMFLDLELIAQLAKVSAPRRDEVIAELAVNDRFFLHVLMAAAESVTASAKKVPFSTVMVGMGGNGVEFGIQVAATGNRWYTAEAPLILGSFLNPTYTVEDMLGYLGDSCVTEVYGLGGMAAVSSPAYVRMTGGTLEDARERTNRARTVSLGEHTFNQVTWDDFKGSPVAIDVRKVVALNTLPISHGGSGLKKGGQAGAGSCELPLECFKKALRGVAEEILPRELLPEELAAKKEATESAETENAPAEA